MKQFRFDETTGRKITHYGSDFALTKILQKEQAGALHIACLHIPAGGLVGYHQASINQLFSWYKAWDGFAVKRKSGHSFKRAKRLFGQPVNFMSRAQNRA